MVPALHTFLGTIQGDRLKVEGGRLKLEPKIVETEKVLNGLIRA